MTIDFLTVATFSVISGIICSVGLLGAYFFNVIEQLDISAVFMLLVSLIGGLYVITKNSESLKL